MIFNKANDAFEYYYDTIIDYGVEFGGCKTIFNVGFDIISPMENEITTPWRKWKKEYADYEWAWYLSKDPNAEEIAKKAVIWAKMMDASGNVQSNYGWQIHRNDQWVKVVNILKKDPQSRRAVLSIYDGKEIDEYTYDTPCTIGLQFYIFDNKLNMTVIMRSNDLVYGFCNDQYTFSKYQEMMARELNCEIGMYHHFVNNLHIYPRHYHLKVR
jgi:thymidylate synthase